MLWKYMKIILGLLDEYMIKEYFLSQVRVMEIYFKTDN